MTEPPRLRRPATPRTRSALEQMVGRYSRHYGIPQARVRNWISFMILAGALERVQDETGASAFIVKGGVALELRLRLRARATRDFDATFRERFGEMLAVLDDALERPYGGFRFMRRGEMRDLGGKAKRIEVRVQYRDKPWSTVHMEVSVADDHAIEAERVPATDLSELGLDGPEFVQCLSVRIQIAQKIHAVTSPPRGDRPNERYRDLVDLWLLRELGAELASVRQACEDVFARRGTHAWPPELIVPDHWPDPFARLAGEVGLPTQDVHVAAEAIRSYIEQIATAELPWV